METLSEDAIQRIAHMAGQNHEHQIVTVKHEETGKELTLLITRSELGGMVLKDLTDQLAKFDINPQFIKGTAVMGNLDSLIALTNRFKNTESALFGERIGNNKELMITAVIDYHDRIHVAGKPGEDPVPPAQDFAVPQHGQHRIKHTFPLSDEIKAWSTVAGEPLDLLEFALFLEDNILDVLALPTFLTGGGAPIAEADKKLKDLIDKLDGHPCGPQRLMELSKGLQINEDTKAKVFIDKNTGEQSIGFENEHQDANGNKLVVPNMFLVAIPIFEGGDPYRIPVRLRYRKKNGSLSWLIEPYQLDRYIKHAFTEACERASEATGLPLFFGQPQS